MVKDVFYELPAGSVKIDGLFEDKINIIVENTLKKLNYEKLVDFFRLTLNQFATGEFWGKTVRAGCLLYKFTQDKELFGILEETVNDMLSVQKEDGCISTVPYETQPNGTHGSDLWERKYAMLGLLSFHDITGREDVLNAVMRLCDYTISQVGNSPKTPITETGWAFYGIESSSILEPVVRLYGLTKEKRYLDFAKYIIDSGACKRENIFEAIYKKDPKDIGSNGIPEESIAKAYEMMSCFEGMLEFYRATGDRKYLDNVQFFYDKLIEQEITLLGSGGADKPFNLGPGIGEQWNHTAYEQTNPDIDLMMETCVTVYWMKLCHQLFRLTGSSKIADQIEISAYNALIGAIKPDGKFFEYFPRFNGTRNPKVNYSFNIDGFDLSCCTANGPTGLALFASAIYMRSEKGLCINYYVPGKVTFEDFVLHVETDYPVTGRVNIKVETKEKKQMELMFRVPSWTKSFEICVNDEDAANIDQGYAKVERQWQDGDIICINIDLGCRVYDAPLGSNRLGDDFVAVMRGPILLARDRRLGEDIYEKVSFWHLDLEPRKQQKRVREYDTEPEYILVEPGIDALMQIKVRTDKGYINMVDYQSAGITWDERSEFASWLPRENRE
ncbi:MAG: hypothetical protein GX166_08785 [Clostridiaceae bacterium]|nr:hypothetical protein [Clostridiaceae bacterium]